MNVQVTHLQAQAAQPSVGLRALFVIAAVAAVLATQAPLALLAAQVIG